MTTRAGTSLRSSISKAAARNVARKMLSIRASLQQGLGVAAERLHPVEPLSPEHGSQLLAERVDAVRLDRSTPLDPAELAPIVELLEGNPLALEMAAGRARILPLAELRARLGTSFELLRKERGRGAGRPCSGPGAADRGEPRRCYSRPSYSVRHGCARIRRSSSG